MEQICLLKTLFYSSLRLFVFNHTFTVMHRRGVCSDDEFSNIHVPSHSASSSSNELHADHFLLSTRGLPVATWFVHAICMCAAFLSLFPFLVPRFLGFNYCRLVHHCDLRQYPLSALLANYFSVSFKHKLDLAILNFGDIGIWSYVWLRVTDPSAWSNNHHCSMGQNRSDLYNRLLHNAGIYSAFISIVHP